MMSFSCSSIGAALLAILVAALIATSPKGVTPNVIPDDSYTNLVPPWPIFRALVPLSDFFQSAAAALTPPNVRLLNLATSFWKSEVLYALTKNGVIDAVGDGPVYCGALAKTIKLDPAVTCRYMNAGVKLGLFDKDSDGAFSATEMGKLVQGNTTGNMRSFVLMINEESRDAWRAAGVKSIKTGAKSGFHENFGTEFWEYHESRPEKSKQFDEAMLAVSVGMIGAIIADYPLPKPDAIFCDIGGGQGSLLANVLHHYPNATGILFDLPNVAGTTGQSFLTKEGLKDRAKVITGSFFDELASELQQCDVFFLKFILHDWDDESCLKILRNIKEIARPGSEIVNADFVRELRPAGSSMETSIALMDINMLASNPMGAVERTFKDFKTLYRKAGFAEDPQLIPLRDLMSVIRVRLN